MSTPTSQPPPPPLVVAAVNLKTVVNHRQKVNEIAAASVLWCREVKSDGPMAQPEWNTAAQVQSNPNLRLSPNPNPNPTFLSIASTKACGKPLTSVLPYQGMLRIQKLSIHRLEA